MNRRWCEGEVSDVSGDSCHPDGPGPNTELLVSLQELLQAGQRAQALPRLRRELQLRRTRLPPLHRLLLLPGLSEGLTEGERKAEAIAQASGGEDGEVTRVRLL